MQPIDLASSLRETLVVDVREPREWEAGRIEGAVHVPLAHLEDRAGELGAGRPVVAVCRTGARSAEAAALLRERGLDADSLEGGLLAWSEAGLSVTTPDGRPGKVAEQPEDGPEPEDGVSEGGVLDGGVLDGGAFHTALIDVLGAIEEHFGDREPSEEEIRGYLLRRLIAEGRTAEEAEEILGPPEGTGPRGPAA